MKIEQQVCSLELAKKLKELGAKQESEFYWITDKDGREINIAWHKELPVFVFNNNKGFSAFTVAELGDMLPGEIEHKGQYWYWHTGKNNGGIDAWYYHYENAAINLPKEWLCIGSAKTEADARAKMLVYLIENKLITL